MEVAGRRVPAMRLVYFIIELNLVLNLLAITTFLVRGFSNSELSLAGFGYYCFAAGLLLLVALCSITRIFFLVEWRRESLGVYITRALGVYLIVMSFASFFMVNFVTPFTWSDWIVGVFFFIWTCLVIYTTYMVENSEREIRDIRRKIRYLRDIVRRIQPSASDDGHLRSNSDTEGNSDSSISNNTDNVMNN